MPLVMNNASLDVLDKAVLGVVQQHIAARCPPESPTDVMFNLFNDPRHDPTIQHPWCWRRRCAHHIMHVYIMCLLADAARC